MSRKFYAVQPTAEGASEVRINVDHLIAIRKSTGEGAYRIWLSANVDLRDGASTPPAASGDAQATNGFEVLSAELDELFTKYSKEKKSKDDFLND